MWLENEMGISKPQIANRPEIWNISFDKICRGDRITLFGEALGNPVHFSDGGNAPKRAAIKNIETGECFKLDSAGTTGYTFDIHKHMAEYHVPMEAPLGKYNLYVRSGTCGRFGWSEPYQFEIVEANSLNYYFRTKWNRSSDACPEMPKCEVKTIYNDDPSPLADYADKIQSAIDSLENGGLVLLTSGTFPISKTISIKPNVVVLGAGKSTVIKAAEGREFDGNIILDSVFSAKPAKLRGWANDWRELYIESRTGTAIRLCTDAGIEGVTVEMGGGINVGILVADDKIDTANNVFISKVEVQNYGVSQFVRKDKALVMNAGLLVGAKTKDLVVWGCTFAATQPIYILPSRHTFAKIMNNDFLCRPRQVNETMLAGLRNSIISGNLFADGRRAFVTNQGFSHNWVYQNRVTGIDRAEGALEAFMSEHGNGEWSGHGVAFGENYVDIECNYDIMKLSKGVPYKERFYHYQRFLFVFDGRGFSQYRKIIDVIEDGTKKRLILDKPWNVVPDETSALSILFGTHHNLWVDNNTSLSNGHSQFVWGCGFENVVAGHCMELSAGVRFQSYHLYDDVSSDLLINASYEKTVTKSISVGVLAFNKIIRCQTKASGMAVRMQSNDLPNEDPEIWSEFNKTRGVFGNTIKSCAFDGSCDALNYAKNLHHLKPITSGILLDGAYNRIVDNYLFAFKKPIAFINDCEGNMVSRNEFRGEEARVVGNAKVCGRDVK